MVFYIERPRLDEERIGQGMRHNNKQTNETVSCLVPWMIWNINVVPLTTNDWNKRRMMGEKKIQVVPGFLNNKMNLTHEINGEPKPDLVISNNQKHIRD